jgi:NADH-quinone oxidoreductase subunit D
MSRSVGIKRDLRLSKLETYSNYYYINFRSFIGQHGDCYDRFLIRMNEMSESLNICTQVLSKINCVPVNNNTKNINLNKHYILEYINEDNFFKKNINNYKNMEEIIKHFKYWSDGFVVSSN